MTEQEILEAAVIWANWSGLDWIIAVGVLAGIVAALFAVLQFFRRSKSSQRASGGGVNIGGDVGGDVSTNFEKPDDPA